MKRFLFFLIILSLLLTSCSIKKGMVLLGIEQTALASSQTAFSLEKTKTIDSINQSMAATQNIYKTKEAELVGTQAKLEATATFQVSVINTQQAISQKEIENKNILEQAALARSNPEVEGIDPVLDGLLISTDIGIGSEGFEFKEMRYSEEKIAGVNLAARNIYYDSSDSTGDFYVLMFASKNPSLFPSVYRQVLDNNDAGTWNKVVVSQQPYFYKEINRGNGYEIATIVKLKETCSVLTVVDIGYGEEVNTWIDYLVDTSYVLESTNLPLCEGT